MRIAWLALLTAHLLLGQLLTPGKLLQAPTDSWPTYNGDYSGKRFSTLQQIHSGNIGRLAPSWMFRVSNVGALRGVGAPEIKSTPLMVKGVLYFTIPDHVYAVDARTGLEIWHYDWQDRGGHLIGNRGVGHVRRLAVFHGARWLGCFP